MKRRLSIALALLLCAWPLQAEKASKILVNSYQTQQAADAALVDIRNHVLNHRDTPSQAQEGYDFHSRKFGNFYAVTIEPLFDQKSIKLLLKIVKSDYKDAFVSTSAMTRLAPPPHQNEPTSSAFSASVAIQTAQEPQPQPSDPIPAATTKLTPEEEMRYLRKPQPDTADTSAPLLYATVLLGVLIAVLIRIRRKKGARKLPTEHFNEMLLSQSEPLEHTPTGYKPKVDLHSHLIPGIDDGAESMDEAIELIRRLKALGYTKLITTPHIADHRYPNTSAIILEGLKELRIELRVRNIDIEIEAASEYYLDEHFMHLLEQRDILTFGGSFVLFELSYVNHPIGLFEMIEKIQQAGYKPVLAHPERYLYMYRAFEKYERLKTMGVYFQLNLNSLTGYYSAEVKTAAMELLDRGMIDFIGSDTHKVRHVQTLGGVFDAPVYAHLCARNRLLNNLL